MASDLPVGLRIARRVDAGGAASGLNSDRPTTENTTREQQQPEPANLQVFGCVDTFTPPNLLRGWALQEGRSDPVNIEVLVDGRQVGTGQTGENRPRPTENCGFSVAVSEPITVSQIRGHSVSVNAIDDHGNAYKLPIWPSPLLRLIGWVDSFRPPDIVCGWVRYESSDLSLAGPLDLKVLLDDTVIGIGQTGQNRPQGFAGAGFSMRLFEPITAADICSGALRIYAIDCANETHELRVWPQLRQELSADRETDDWRAQLAHVRKLVGRKFVAARKPYRTDGIILSPACAASQLRSGIDEDDLARLLPGVSMPEVLAFLDRDRLPIPQAANRENYCPGQDAVYWLLGLADYLKVKACWEKHLSSISRLLDFGGSTGRVFRHLYCQASIEEIYACDSKKINIEWCKKYLPSDIRVFLNGFYPNLPFTDGYFDMVTAFSVFTHIDDFEDGWLLELSRILKPGGIAYVTVADEQAWSRMPPALEKVLRASPSASDVNFEEPIPLDRMVFAAGDGTPYGINVFHRQDYIRRVWARYFDVEEIVPQEHHFQTVVILRNKRGNFTSQKARRRTRAVRASEP